MSAHRFFLEAPFAEDAPLPLRDEDVAHAVSVLRIRPGEEIDLVEPGKDGRIVVAAVTSASRAEGICARFVCTRQRTRLLRLVLVQGLLKGEKMDAVIRQAVELGVESVWPVVCERSVSRLEARRAAAKLKRWERIARSAAAQSSRDTIPVIEDVASGLSTIARKMMPTDCLLVAWEEEGGRSARQAIEECLGRAGSPDLPDGRIVVVVGPEGGLTEAEVATLAGAGAVPFTLGPTVLRAETAAVAALATVSAIAGEQS